MCRIVRNFFRCETARKWKIPSLTYFLLSNDGIFSCVYTNSIYFQMCTIHLVFRSATCFRYSCGVMSNSFLKEIVK